MLDVRLNYKTARVNTALPRIMTNVGGPNQIRRLLLAKVKGQSIMIYAASVWGPSLGIKTYVRTAKSLFQLSALRVASDFCTVSYEAVGVISGLTPPDVMAMELKRICDRVKTC